MATSSIDIRYVAAPPGTGKTKAAVEFMRQHILGGLKGKDVGCVFYIAPTVLLLNQTMEYLKNRLKTEQARQCLFIEVSSKRKDIPPVKQRILNLLDGRNASNLHSRPFGNGCILFITHPAFVELDKHAMFKKTTVLFDEARKWAEMASRIKMPPDVEELFNRLFIARPVRGNSRVAQVLPKRIPHNKLAELVKTKGQGKVFPQFEELFTNLSSNSSRMKVYRMLRNGSMGKTMVQITWPSNPFKGFARTYILSADFRNSQMYHLLCKEGHRPKKVTEEFMNKYLKGGYYHALDTIRKRHDHLVIAPLLDTNRMPSLSMLQKGMVIPKDKVEEFLSVLDKLDITSEELKDLSIYYQSPESAGIPTKTHLKLLKYMKESGCRFDVINWQLESAYSIAKRWFKKHRTKKEDGSTEPGLLIVNKDYHNKFSVSKNDLEYVEVGRVEGINEYIKSNLVVFLAGINPTPELKDVMAIEIPDYNPDEDYVVDKAIQCLGRGNIRDHASTEPMLAIVPTTHLGERIVDRMGDQPSIDMSYCRRLGSYTVWNTQEAKRAKKNKDPAKALEERQRKDKERQAKFRNNPINKQLADVRANLNYYLKHPPKTEKAKGRKAELEKSLTKLLKARNKR